MSRDFNPAAIVPAEASRIEREDWEAPPILFRQYHERHRFTIDVAANAVNRLVPRYFDKESDGLRQSWLGERVWLHPPHGEAEHWCKKAMQEASRGVLVVGLIPARTDKAWWRDSVLSVARVRFLVGVLPWRLLGIPIEAAVGRRKVEAPRGGFAIVEWHRGQAS